MDEKEHPSQLEGLPIGGHAETFTEVPDDPFEPAEEEPAPIGSLQVQPPAHDASPEEKDLHWYTHVYQGDKMPQLTFRAVAMGGLLGMAMSVSNLYTTLKVGWAFGVAITACVISYVIWNFFRLMSGGRLSQMSILENNCMQSTASAAGYSTGATIATAFGALMILDPSHTHQPWWIVGSFTLATGAMGVFLAIPMKRQMINQEQLPFPSGIAAATTLRSLYSEGKEAVRKAYALVIALFCAAIIAILKTEEGMFKATDRFFGWMKEHLFSVQIPAEVPHSGFMQVAGKKLAGFSFEPSALLIAAGMIVGLRVSLSMLVASVLLYVFIAPYLIGLDLAQAGVEGYVVSIPTGGGGTLFAPTRWSLWGGTAVMVFASLMSLALQWRTVARSFNILKSGSASKVSQEKLEEMARIEVPGSWLVAGMVPITIAMLVVQMAAFHINFFAGLVAVAMSFVLSLVACRATGETDTTPIGAMGKVMQLIFAFLSPGNVTHNLMSAGVAANSASSSADLLTDLKSGYLLGANPKKQFIAQFIGIFFGTLAIVPAWYLMVPTIEKLEAFPLPATLTWVAVAQVLSKGWASLPQSAVIAAVIGAFLGCLIPILEKTFPKARPYLPSAMGLGLGWVVTFSNALAFTIGALIALIWLKAAPKSQETYNVPIASGLVAGESLVSALLAMLATAIGLMAANQG
ncbi:OPT family oligopeptide transporter [bacterium CPR1]|nr:OPT family oligopeptide transporter [bacterium CPR1]